MTIVSSRVQSGDVLELDRVQLMSSHSMPALASVRDFLMMMFLLVAMRSHFTTPLRLVSLKATACSAAASSAT